MATPSTPTPAPAAQPKLRIYFLPNLMTACNLFCGFVALTKIVEARIDVGKYDDIQVALAFILLACIFDMLDGRLARMGGVESPFGREFDSLADLISFGAAPAFLVYRIVLHDVFASWGAEIGWFIASIYLICGALRLARFNCQAAMPAHPGDNKDFVGFPIPAAAGLVASVTLLLIRFDRADQVFKSPQWCWVLPLIMLFLSLMMVSEVRYPSFKKLDLRTQRPFTKMVVAILIIGCLLILWKLILPVILPLMFTLYLIYGFIRPRISRKMREEIEEEADDAEDSSSTP